MAAILMWNVVFPAQAGQMAVKGGDGDIHADRSGETSRARHPSK